MNKLKKKSSLLFCEYSEYCSFDTFDGLLTVKTSIILFFVPLNSFWWLAHKELVSSYTVAVTDVKGKNHLKM